MLAPHPKIPFGVLGVGGDVQVLKHVVGVSSEQLGTHIPKLLSRNISPAPDCRSTRTSVTGHTLSYYISIYHIILYYYIISYYINILSRHCCASIGSTYTVRPPNPSLLNRWQSASHMQRHYLNEWEKRELVFPTHTFLTGKSTGK